jgi:hypothetical protein
MADLATLKREELDAHAESVGFPNPAGFQGTKAELVAALERFTADGTLPEGHSPAEEPAADEDAGKVRPVGPIPEAEVSAEASDTLTKDVKAYLRDPSRVRPPAAVINFGADRPIRPSEE